MTNITSADASPRLGPEEPLVASETAVPAAEGPSKRRRVMGRLMKTAPAEDRWARLREIETLDPVKDCVRIYWLFQQDFKNALRFRMIAGLFVTYAPPRISRVLTTSGEFHQRLAKRLTDTMLIDGAYHEHGFGPGPGREAVRRMNEMHRQYDIHPDDFLFIGCHEPVAAVWYATEYGWRAVTEKERVAACEFAKLRGKYMWDNSRTTPYPETLEEMAQWCAEWEEEQLFFEPQNHTLAAALIDFVLNDVPRPMRPAMRAFLFSVGPDPRLITGCGYEMPSRLAQRISKALMRWYGKLDPTPSGPSAMAEDLVSRFYPNGYEIKDLGTHL